MIELPPLPYDYDALKPVLSADTLRAHHDRHHAAYVKTANTLAAEAGMKDLSVEEIIRRSAASPANRKLYNNAAQAWNHAFFWNCMTPNPAQPTGGLAQAVISEFGGLDGARKSFVEEGAAHFGSGWVWLAVRGGRACIFTTHDADNVVTRDLTALLVCDLWEHAYYLDHTNDREGFLEAWWDKLANWDFAAKQFTAAAAGAPGWRYPLAAHAS